MLALVYLGDHRRLGRWMGKGLLQEQKVRAELADRKGDFSEQELHLYVGRAPGVTEGNKHG